MNTYHPWHDPRRFAPKDGKCIYCEHPILAVTPEGGFDAMREHADYVNATADRAVDPHFEDMRLTELLAS